MKKYFLTVMYPAISNSQYTINGRDQVLKVTVEANDLEISEAGCYIFKDGKGIKACYPIKYTVIDKIDNR